MKRRIEISDVAELKSVAQLFLSDFKSPKVCAFTGEMGVGKTTLIAALCKELGVEEGFGSPTYSIVNEYRFPNGLVYHFDCYRLKTSEEALDFGIEEYLESENWCFIEWPAMISGFLPPKRIELSIELQGNNRVINWSSVGF